ncbi:uncharacterized protein PV07_02814 [Cladophialophora immunda]|uniref:Uncharacterized protein n=1 Tax=Cladophialophora immunda TaxID=569365 RepID=A0A0D2CM56_9EURO|nr:uncharacterized protein PV07_02814 [Cladophialophora immunda]KIW31140.1 hypothetical protein PV07_02814 [Cladophialophora immunda]
MDPEDTGTPWGPEANLLQEDNFPPNFEQWLAAKNGRLRDQLQRFTSVFEVIENPTWDVKPCHSQSHVTASELDCLSKKGQKGRGNRMCGSEKKISVDDMLISCIWKGRIGREKGGTGG